MYYLLYMFLKSTSSSPHMNLVTFYQLFSISFKLLFTLYNVNWVGTSAASAVSVRKHEESATASNIKIAKDDKDFLQSTESRHLNSLTTPEWMVVIFVANKISQY